MRSVLHLAKLAVLLCAVTLGTGCATILRSSNRDVTVYGPDDLRVEGVAMARTGAEGGKTKFEAEVPRKAEQIRVHAGGVDATVPLEKTTSAGWVVADFVFGGIIALLVDYATSAWNNFDPVDVTPALAKAGWTNSAQRVVQAPPPQKPPDVAEVRRRSDEAMSEVRPASTAPARKAVVDRGKLAVLDFKNFAQDLKPEDVRYFADVVRGATLRVSPALEVMTRENLLVLLKASGTDAATCEGECEVDTGRRIGADAVITGEILKVGTRFKMSLKLHETHDGRLLSTAVASGRSIDELDESAQAAARDLLTPQ